MEIRIVKGADSSQLEEIKVRWQFAAKRSFKNIVLSVSMGVAYLLLGLLESTHNKPFWNFWTSIGIAFMLVALISSYGLYKGRQRWIANSKKNIEKQNKSGIPTEYIFSDSLLTVRDENCYSEFKWRVFCDYMIYKNYLFLFFRLTETNNITIDLTKISESDSSNLLSLIKEKLPLRQK